MIRFALLIGAKTPRRIPIPFYTSVVTALLEYSGIFAREPRKVTPQFLFIRHPAQPSNLSYQFLAFLTRFGTLKDSHRHGNTFTSSYVYFKVP